MHVCNVHLCLYTIKRKVLEDRTYEATALANTTQEWFCPVLPMIYRYTVVRKKAELLSLFKCRKHRKYGKRGDSEFVTLELGFKYYTIDRLYVHKSSISDARLSLAQATGQCMTQHWLWSEHEEWRPFDRRQIRRSWGTNGWYVSTLPRGDYISPKMREKMAHHTTNLKLYPSDLTVLGGKWMHQQLSIAGQT